MLCANATYGATETISFYSEGGYYNNTTCTSGGNVTLPATDPTHSYSDQEYEFVGWRVYDYDFSTIDASNNYATNGTIYYAKQSKCFTWNGSKTVEQGCNIAEVSDLATNAPYGQWKAYFSYGMVRGDSLCSVTSGTQYVAGTPNESNGLYCWCRATGYQPTNSDIIYSQQSSPKWIFHKNFAGTGASCVQYCASDCGRDVRIITALRCSLFGGECN